MINMYGQVRLHTFETFAMWVLILHFLFFSHMRPCFTVIYILGERQLSSLLSFVISNYKSYVFTSIAKFINLCSFSDLYSSFKIRGSELQLIPSEMLLMVPVPVKQRWRIGVHGSHETIKIYTRPTTNQTTTKVNKDHIRYSVFVTNLSYRVNNK